MRVKANIESLKKIALKIANYSKPGDLIAIVGDLGTGKTTFSKEFGKSLGIKENIKSPTFNYVIEYQSGIMPMYHFDVYRLETASEIYDTGYEDYLHGEGVILVEWADIIASELPEKYLLLNLYYTGEDESREIELKWVNSPEREKEIEEYVNIGD